MWILEQINAQNICAFRQLDYTLQQGVTTLVFGNNLDNDAQGSNGSGKSALIETIAIALTGDSLRKVKADEIINDAAEEAYIKAVLHNRETNQSFVIERTISRNNPQQICTTLNEEVIEQPSVNEYDKYILDVLGLSKADIFSNYILSKHKYSSFLSASDREKKELINRFSNGNMVDESIEVLQGDMSRVRFDLNEAEKVVAKHQGRVDAINEQIATTQSERKASEDRKAQLIAANQEHISNQRGKIRAARNVIEECNAQLDIQDEAANQLQNIEEDGNKGVEKAYNEVKEIIERALPNARIKNYLNTNSSLASQLANHKAKANSAAHNLKAYESDVDRAAKEREELTDKLAQLEATTSHRSKQLRSEIEEMQTLIGTIQDENTKVRNNIMQLESNLNCVVKALAGTITCPKCKHKFILSSEYSVAELAKQQESLQRKIKRTQKVEAENNAKVQEADVKIKAGRNEMRDMETACSELSKQAHNALLKLNNLKNLMSDLNRELTTENNLVVSLENQIQNLRQSMFDEAFDLLDAASKQAEDKIKSLERDIANYEGSIEVAEKAIIELESTSVENAVAGLEEKKEAYCKDLNKAIVEKETIEQQLAKLTAQEARFVDFKTHLANSKIEALGQITNEFLEAIGSDLRIAFSGYTVLKSGKIRDKISISVLRDGVDCGSFAKMSQGEQCRANLASILALHKLTNVNCPDDKGLDLLILDEILDATDEAGLASMFDALNSLQITAMVVSHGLVHESYPYRLTVTKQNGVSTLNGNEKQ